MKNINIKNFLYYFVTLIILFILINFYLNNKENFNIIYNISYFNLIVIFLLGLIYLFLEAIILKKIIQTFNKDLSLIESFSLINLTYLLNTFVQFTGLAFRIFYLKTKMNIKISEFIYMSFFLIFLEFIIFNIFGVFSLLLYGFYYETNLLLFIFIFIFSLITIFSLLAIFYTNFFINFFKKIYFFKNFNFDSLMEVRKNFISNIYFFLFLYFSQYLIMTSVFFFSYVSIVNDSSLLISMVSSSVTNIVLFVNITPYSLGVLEFLVFISNTIFDINLTQTLIVTSLLRLSNMVWYIPIGIIAIFILKNNLRSYFKG